MSETDVGKRNGVGQFSNEERLFTDEPTRSSLVLHSLTPTLGSSTGVSGF
jgi:hypothetical protein